MESMLSSPAEPIFYTLIAFIAGVVLYTLGLWMIPKWLDRLTPNIDETKEILNGNQAVATYFGRVVSAAILGLSLIIAAAILAGIHGT